MDKKALIIKDLFIRKMPGFPSGMEPYTHFADQLNIIAGPNASGKSSTAKLIQQLIWQDHDANIEASGSLSIDNEPWQIHIDPIQTKTERNGIPHELAGLPPPESRDHYLLALQELINAEDKDLAKQIAKEAIGGYDPDTAAQILDYSDKVRNKSSREYSGFIKARDHFRKIYQEQQQLKKEEETLESLNKEKEKTQQAARLRDFYSLTKEYLETRQSLEISKKQLNRFPVPMKKLAGDEFSKITELEEELDQTDRKIEEAKKVIENSRDIIASLKLPSEGVDEVTIETLEQKAEDLIDYEKELRDIRHHLREAEVRVRAAVTAIDQNLDTTSWKGLNLQDVQEMDEYLQTAQKLLSQKQFLEHEIKELEKEVAHDPSYSSENIQSGINALSNWLQEAQSHNGISVKWAIILAATGIITALFTLFTGIYGLAGILLLMLLTFYVLSMRPAQNNNTRETDYKKTGLPLPQNWDTEAVFERFESLVADLQEIKHRESIIPRLKLRQEELHEVNQQMGGILKKEQALREKLGTVPGIPSENLKSHSSLYWFLSNIREWQEHATRKKKLESQEEFLQDQMEKLLDDLNNGFRNFNMNEVTDAYQARAGCKIIAREADSRQRSLEEIKRQEERIRENVEIRQEKNQRLHTVYMKLGLNDGEKEQVRQLTEMLEAYRESVSAHDKANILFLNKEQVLKNHSIYREHEIEIEQLSVDEAVALRNKYETDAARSEEVNRRITEIRTQIGLAKRGDDLENALAVKEKSLDELELLYENNLSSLTGHLLVHKLRETTQTQNKSKVFRDAGKLFSRITNGRYELRIGDINKAAFLAFDTSTQKGQPLDELSTGTRLQLLLAVRLAFIETRENHLRLPLLADELLANSDDVRAWSIMQALIAFSELGRQVFYFTAQDDEVAKWRLKLQDQAPVSCKIFRLQNRLYTGGRKLEDEALSSLPRFENKELPSPSGLNHYEYGKAINVPDYSIIHDQPAKLHLWYLITDTKLLYECLRKNINSWGQLSSFFEHGGRMEGFTDHLLENLNKQMKLLGRFQELFRKGRPRPLDMETLDRSGLISSSFRDKVYRKLEASHGNPEDLLNSLKNKEIPGFRSNKTEELETFLKEEGYIDDMNPLSMEEIMIQLQAFCAALNMDLQEAETFLRRIV